VLVWWSNCGVIARRSLALMKAVGGMPCNEEAWSIYIMLLRSLWTDLSMLEVPGSSVIVEVVACSLALPLVIG
jgi:hypothetical protein